MKVKLIPQRAMIGTVILSNGENSIYIDGKSYYFDPNIVEYDPIENVISSAYRDDAGELYVAIFKKYDTDESPEFEAIDPITKTWKYGVNYETFQQSPQTLETEIINVTGRSGDSLLTQFKEELCKNIETQRDAIFKQGFEFNGYNYQADPEARSIATSIVTAINAGLPIQFPLQWRSGENIMNAFNSAQEFLIFAGYLLNFTNQVYLNIFTSKDLIRNSSGKEQALNIYYERGWK